MKKYDLLSPPPKFCLTKWNKNQWKKPLYIIREIHEISVTSDYPPLKEQKYTYPPIPDKKNSEKRSLKKIIKKIEKMVKKPSKIWPDSPRVQWSSLYFIMYVTDKVQWLLKLELFTRVWRVDLLISFIYINTSKLQQKRKSFSFFSWRRHEMLWVVGGNKLLKSKPRCLSFQPPLLQFLRIFN